MNRTSNRSRKWWLAPSVVMSLVSTVYAQVPNPAASAGGVASPALGTVTSMAAVAPATPGADPEPPGAKGSLPTSMEAIAKATDIPYQPKPAGHLVKFNLQDADLAELVNHISGLTGRRFIYGQKVRNIKATVVSPEPVTLAEAYEAFLSILEANGMTVIPHGRFYKIVDSGGVVSQSTPVIARGEPVPVTDRYVTRLYRLQSIDATEAATLLGKFKSKEADISVYAPGSLLIITDTGSNVDRMIRILEEIDVGEAGQSMWIEPVHYGAATDLSARINELFQLTGAQGGALGGGLSRVTADPLTNSLIIVGTEEAYLKLLEMMKRLDAKPDGTGSIRVVPVQHAKADELANVLTQMMQNVKTAKETGQAPNAAADRDMFEGAVRIVADKATNSLLITSSARDYATLRLVIEQLDQRRRQVFIEAVIMDLDVTDSTKLGTSWHGGYRESIGSSSPSIFAGGFNSENTLAFPPNQDMLQGFAIGVRGPDLPGTQNLLGTGVSIPAFGVALHALTTSGSSNVLATPHIIATDNIAAEIQIGKNIPLQQNVTGGLGNLASLASAAGGTNASSLVSSLGGLGGYGYNTPRQDVGIKIKVTPHINEKNQVRLELEQESSDQGATSGTIGAVTVIKRTANTNITVDDQQTVIIGGLMREEQYKSDEKIPLLGDIPVLGFLFRHETVEKKKSNLLLVLTPYVIRDQADLRRIFERKMQERQEFLDRYFVFTGRDWEPPRDYARANGLVEEIRQAYLAAAEQLRLLRESEAETLDHQPGAPIELPDEVVSGPGRAGGAAKATPGAAPAAAPAAAPKAPAAASKTSKAKTKAAPKKNTTKKPAPRRGGKPRSDLDAPLVLRQPVRNINAEWER